MGTIQIAPASLQGRVAVPSSKSQAHRAILCAAMAGGVSEVVPISHSKDMEATISAVRNLGADAERRGNRLLVDGSGIFSPDRTELNCFESGSTLRFLIPIAAAGGIDTRFYGEGLLPQRPIATFLDLLPAHGVACKTQGGLPLEIQGKLAPGTFEIPGNVSSQYITGLLLALPLLEGDSRIVLTTPLESKAYVDITLDVMAAFGIAVQKTDDGYFVKGGQKYKCRSYTVESDWSQAAFFFTAGALNGRITLTGLRLDSLQGDKAILPLMQQMGAHITVENNTITVEKSTLHGIRIDASQIPDLVPALAVACAFAQGESIICGAQRLRFKESDRIESTIKGLRAIGTQVTQTADGMIIQGGGSLHGGSVHSFNDHRIAMAFAVAALNVAGDTTISGWESINKSYPSFLEDYQALGGKVHVIRMGNKS